VRVLIASTAGAGHFGPLVPVIQALQRRGDELLATLPPAVTDRARSLGLTVRTVPQPPAAELAELTARMATGSRREAAVLGNREIFGRLNTAATLATIEATMAEWAPDVVVHEAAEYASAIAAERQRIVHHQVAVDLADVEWSSLELAAPALEPYSPDIVPTIRASGYLSRLPGSLDPSSYPATHRFRQPIAAGNRAEPPLVYISLGTIAGNLAGGPAAYRAAIAAVTGLPVQAVLTMGGTLDPTHLGPLPPNVRAQSWVDQDEILARATLLIGHGGSGTTFDALAQGVPIVFVPFMAGQFTNARLVSAAGAGMEADASSVRPAVERILGRDTYHAAAARLAEEMAGAATLDELLSAVLDGA